MKHAKNAGRRPIGARSLERILALQPGGRLTINTHKGSLELMPWDRPEVRVEARIEVPIEVEEDMVEEVLDAVEVTVTGSGAAAEVRSVHKEAPVRRTIERQALFVWCFQRVEVAPHVHYRIQAPRQLDLHLADYASDLSLSGFEGNVEVNSYRGRLQVESLRGHLRVRSHRGDVVVAGLDGSLDLKGQRGALEVGFDRLAADSRVEAFRGSAVVAMPPDQGFEVVAEVGSRGVFRSDYELVTSSLGGSSLTARLGDGGPRLVLATHRGRLRLVRAAG